MFELAMFFLWPYGLGSVLGIAWACFARRRRRARPGRPQEVPVAAPRGAVRALAIGGFGIAILVTLLLQLWGAATLFTGHGSGLLDILAPLYQKQVAVPVILAGLAALLIALPLGSGSPRRRAEPIVGDSALSDAEDAAEAGDSVGTEATAQMTRRTILTFVDRRALSATLAALALLLITVIAAGIASSADDDGSYTLYTISNGDIEVGTTIYGWYFSVPMLVLVAILIIVCAIGLIRIARSPLGQNGADVASDAAKRRGRALCLLAAACGGLLLQLGSVWLGLAGTASLRGGSPIGGSWVGIWTTFAAMETPLRVLSWVAVVCGFTVWCRALVGLLLPVRSMRSVEAVV